MTNEDPGMTSTLTHLLQNSAGRFESKEALTDKDRRFTYGQLWTDVVKTARLLRDRGLERGERAGILIENSREYIVAYYGILLAGGVVVAMNVQAKARNIAACLTHCEARLLLADGRHKELRALMERLSGRLRLVTLRDGGHQNLPPLAGTWDQIQSQSAAEPSRSELPRPEELASLIYTSGTTGDPKGVILTHENLQKNLEAIVSYLELTERDSIVNVLPFHYSYGNSVLHTHLAVGGRLVLENSMIYPRRVLERIDNEKVTGFSGVPSTFALLLARCKLSDFDLKSLRYMTQAGGPMPPVNVKRLTRELPHVRFFVMYGQTEASARLAYLPPERLTQKLGSCGVPIPGVEIEVRDDQGHVAPPFVTGEIYARGKNIMRGYWNNVQATRQALVDGWLKTGDLAHTDEEGYLFIDGRASEMIKSGAHRISPKEIEEVITELDCVAEVAAVGVHDDILGQVVKVVVVPKPGRTVEPSQVQKHCAKNLALYKVPRSVEISDELPKTSSGKIRRFMLAN